MRKRSTSEVKRRTGAEMRAQRDQRLSAPGPMMEASRRADVIRAGLTSYAATMDKIADVYQRQDWRTLGYESFNAYAGGEFGEARLKLTPDQRARILPAFLAVGMSKRGAAAALGVDDKTIRNDLRGADNSALPGEVAQVKTDAEVADEVARATAVFDEMNSGNAGTPPSGVPGQDSPDAPAATSTGLQPATDLDDPHPGPDSPADRPLPSDTAEGSTGSVATDQLGIDSSLAGDGASSSDDAERPPAPAAGDEAAEASTPPPPPKTFTEGQALATPSTEPVLPSAPAGVSEAGGVEDGPVSPGPGLSSADPASDWMTSWRGLIRSASAVSEYLTEDELAEVSDDMATLAKVLFEDTP